MKKLIVCMMCCLLAMSAAFAWAEELTLTPENVVEAAKPFAEEIVGAMEKRAEEYAPKVITLKNGIKVQRTPNTPDAQWHYYEMPISYNNYYLDADNRGCAVCHGDLADLAANLKGYEHVILQNNLGIEITYQMCILCHSGGGFVDNYEDTFGGMLHAIHRNNKAFDAMGGDCWSCHQVDSNGNMAVWEDIRHETLRGISHIPNTEIQGEFSWNQDRLVARDDVFSYDWIARPSEIERYTRWMTGIIPDPETDGIYDQWKIAVTGEVDNPVEMTITEWLKVIPAETTVMTMECLDNVMGAPLIANCEITGIPVVKMLEYAGIRDNVQSLKGHSYNPWVTGDSSQVISNTTHNYEWLKEHGAYIVLEIGGEPLNYKQGYPAQLWAGGVDASSLTKEIREIKASADPYVADYESHYSNVYDNGNFMNRPNAGIWDLYEGQIFPAGEPITFSGYAHCNKADITTIEVSFDLGKTWNAYPVEGDDLTKWVCWEFTWMPPATGAYTIDVRASSSDGYVSAYPVSKLFNVQ